MEVQKAIEIQATIADVLRFVPFALAFILATAIAALMLASRHPQFRSGSLSFAPREHNSKGGHPCLRTQSAACFDFGNIPFGQLMHGVDEFYKDFRNKRVDIADAMTDVRGKLKGKSPAALERQLKEFHSASVDIGCREKGKEGCK
jgi:hypothetical protein